MTIAVEQIQIENDDFGFGVEYSTPENIPAKVELSFPKYPDISEVLMETSKELGLLVKNCEYRVVKQ